MVAFLQFLIIFNCRKRWVINWSALMIDYFSHNVMYIFENLARYGYAIYLIYFCDFLDFHFFRGYIQIHIIDWTFNQIKLFAHIGRKLRIYTINFCTPTSLGGISLAGWSIGLAGGGGHPLTRTGGIKLSWAAALNSIIKIFYHKTIWHFIPPPR